MIRIPSQIGTIALAALVVLSLVAGSITFAGPAAAVGSVAAETSFTPFEVDEATQNQHSFNYSFTGVDTAGDTTLSLSVPGEYTIDSATVEMKNASGAVIATGSTSDNTLEVTATPSTSTVYLNGTVTMTSPPVDADRTDVVKINSTDNDGTNANTTTELTVLNDPLEVTSISGLSDTDVTEETENQHQFSYSFTGVNKSDTTTYAIDVPSEFTIEGSTIAVENASGDTLTSSVTQSGNTLSLTTSSNTETTYLNGSVNLTSPAVPEGSESATYDVVFNASENDRSAELTETIAVSYDGGQPGAPEFLSATQYVQSDGTPAIEVAFSEDIEDFGSNYGLYVDETEVTGDIVDNVNEAQGRVVIELDDTDSRDLTLQLEDGITDADGNALDNPGDTAVTFAPTTVSAGESVSAYSGSVVSVIATSTNTDVTLQGVDDDTDTYFFEGSTGTNSRIFRFDTGGEEPGDYEADIDGEGTAEITVRNLELTLDIQDRNVTTLQTIEGTVEARASGREIRLELLDDSEEVIDEQTVDLSGQGERDFSYDIDSLDLETGEYTVRATDTASGVTVESDTVTVREAGDTEALLPNNVVNEERGDVVAIPIELRNTREATLTVGDDDAGYEASVTVREDDDDSDGEVVVYFNSYAASSVTGSFSGENDLFSVDNDAEVVDGEVSIGVSNLLDAEVYPMSVETDGRETDIQLLSLNQRNTTAIRTWTAPRNQYGSLDTGDDVREGVSDEWLTQDDEIAVGDTVVYEIQASGLEGPLDARGENTVTTEFFDFADASASDPAAQFTVEQRDPGPNQDPLLLELNSSNARVIADSANDTYYVVTRTGDSGPSGVQDDDGDGVIDADEDDYGSLDADDSFDVSFTVFGDDENDLDLTADGEDEIVETTYELTSPEFEMSDPFNVTEVTGQEIFGEATVAPGTEVTVRVRSADGVRPAFLKSETTTVDADGQFLVTLSFNNTNPGDGYTISVDDIGPASELVVDGTVQPVIETPDTDTPAETTTTSTAEPEPSTSTPTTTAATPTPIPTVQTPTTTPGFGVLVTIIALAGVALIALRRESE